MDNTKIGKECGEISTIMQWKCGYKMVQPVGKWSQNFLQIKHTPMSYPSIKSAPGYWPKRNF